MNAYIFTELTPTFIFTSSIIESHWSLKDTLSIYSSGFQCSLIQTRNNRGSFVIIHVLWNIFTVAKGKAQFPKDRQLNACRYFSGIVFKIQSYFMYVFLSILKYLAMCIREVIVGILLKKKKNYKERNEERQTKTRIVF